MVLIQEKFIKKEKKNAESIERNGKFVKYVETVTGGVL